MHSGRRPEFIALICNELAIRAEVTDVNWNILLPIIFLALFLVFCCVPMLFRGTKKAVKKRTAKTNPSGLEQTA